MIFNRYSLKCLLFFVFFALCSCQDPVPWGDGGDGDADSDADGDADGDGDGDGDGDRPELIDPSAIEYIGAFRLPGSLEDGDWAYGGSGATYSPVGDPAGPDDGFPGSIFGFGHDWTCLVSEVSIPAPVDVPSHDLEQLNAAETLQTFTDILEGQEVPGEETLRAAISYSPARGDQTTDKLHFAFGRHYQYERMVSHGWSELDLSSPQMAGLWYLDEFPNFSTNDFLFQIPESWAAANTPGMTLATGRFRDGGLGGMGPALFAYGPWNEGDPPTPGATIPAIPLLLYSDDFENADPSEILADYAHSDDWTGGAWLTTAQASAVVFVGTKGLGDTWYGYRDGTRHDDCQPNCPDIPPGRGWWSETSQAQIIFFDPSELADVASGLLPASSPQPYATLAIDDYLFRDHYINEWFHVAGVAYDRERSLLYIFEPLADVARPVVHVFRV